MTSHTAHDSFREAAEQPAPAFAQADATPLVDRSLLEAEVQEMYRRVALEDNADLHFAVGRELALRVGYPAPLLSLVPAEALASFAGVGYHLDLAALRPGERVLDLGSGSGTDVFCAALLVGRRGSAVGVDFTDEQVAKARRLTEGDELCQAEFVQADIDALPFPSGSFDVVLSNGVINLSPVKHRVFAEAARILRPGGRLAVADIVSARPLKERTRRNVELWAACVAGAIPREAYVQTLETAGFRVQEVRTNDYDFLSERALAACSSYGVESVSISAVKVA
jgi:ubiquinone/menaquinone biosynthesis C-methylase UbiE